MDLDQRFRDALNMKPGEIVVEDDDPHRRFLRTDRSAVRRANLVNRRIDMLTGLGILALVWLCVAAAFAAVFNLVSLAWSRFVA